jgi:DNA-binding GntR family transcriptional regulator
MSESLLVAPAAPAPRAKQPLGRAAYEQIYRKIMTLEYAPGQRLEEKSLVAELGIGRTPVREALLRLAADFMVESVPNHGVVVRPLTVQNTRAAFAALRILERGVADLAVREEPKTDRLDRMTAANEAVQTAIDENDVLGLVERNDEFHRLFSACSGNDYLIHALHKVRCETNRLAYLSFGNAVDPLRSQQEHYRSVVKEHEQIIDGVRRRDGESLKKTLDRHRRAFENRILLYMTA